MADTIPCWGSLERVLGGSTIGDTEQEALNDAQDRFDEVYREVNAWANAVQCASECVEAKVVKWFNRNPAISGRPGDKREVAYKGRKVSRTLDYFEASYDVFCRVTCSLLDSYFDDWPPPSHYHPRAGLSSLRSTPELFISLRDARAEGAHPALFALLDLAYLRVADDRNRRVPGQRIRTDEDGTVIITHGYTDPNTGQFVEEEIDIYDPMPDGSGLLGPLARRVYRHPDGTTTTLDFGYDGRGRLLDIEVTDADGNLVETISYKYDSLGRPYRIEETDADGKILRVTVIAYYSDGSRVVTITDYSTSPPTVRQYSYPPPVFEPETI